MRVLLWMISSGNAIKGGHQTQIQETARHLEMLGVSTHIAYEHEPSLEGFDLVHNFGLDPVHIRRCWEHNLPVATSTIYWARDYVLGINNDPSIYRTFMKRLRVALVLARSALQGKHPQKCEALIERQIRLRVMYEMSDILLPNVQGEADDICRELGVSTPYIVATNAVLPEKYHLPEKPVERNGVLSIGRVEPHKNQLGMIQAMKGSKIPVAIHGFAHPHHAGYMKQCQRAAAKTSNVIMGEPLNDEELVAAYQRSRVHVIPSHFETTGLVSLEAALCGCNVVTTNRGHANGFFGNLAWYCDPAKSRSIREAVEAAYAAPYRQELQEHILNRFTWRHTAEQTLEGYKRALASHRAGHRPKINALTLEASSTA